MTTIQQKALESYCDIKHYVAEQRYNYEHANLLIKKHIINWKEKHGHIGNNREFAEILLKNYSI